MISVEQYEKKIGDLEEKLKEAINAVNHNSRLVDEERLKHEIYRRDGAVESLKWVIRLLVEERNSDGL